MAKQRAVIYFAQAAGENEHVPVTQRSHCELKAYSGSLRERVWP